MRFEIFQIAFVAFAGLATTAPVGSSEDAVVKRLLPTNPYPLADRRPVGPFPKRALPDPPYKELYRSIAKE
ncbi:hypothetical protein F4860DRAFT_486762 [Xylaria cubensis]|nr:hypothetical protein F4860DRAFT_486762 [Xylaria cubensis]